ncbi:MAG TPA: tetratricopeptide repeat protein [Vicinamibacterales bacterium]
MVIRACLVASICLTGAAGAAAQSGVPAAAGVPSGAGHQEPAGSAGTPDTAYFEFLRGRHLESQGKLTEALSAYERAAAADPASAQIRAEIAGLYARQSRTDEAIREARRALELDADNVEANWVLGTIYASLLEARREDGRGRGAMPQRSTDGAAPSIDQAIAHLERARPGRLYDSALHLTLGRLYLARRDWQKAVDVLFYVVDRDPGALDARYLLAQAYDGQGRRDAAIENLRAVLEQEPRFFRALLDLADLYVRERRWDEAAEAYERASSEYPDNVDLKLRHAAALANAGNDTAARELLEAVEKTRPDDARVAFLLVDVARGMRDYDAAERAARRVMELQPGQPLGLQALATVFEDRREYREIVALLEPALSSNPGQAGDDGRAQLPLRLALGNAYMQLGEHEKAIATLDRARREGGADPAIDATRIQAYLEAARAGDALMLATEARARHPEDVRLLALEAEARLKSGDREGAVQLVEESLQRLGDRPEVHVALAGVLIEGQELARAEKVLVAARTRFPEEIAIPFQLGAVYEEQERYEEAEKAFREALKLDPEHAPTLNYLGYMLADRGQRLDEAVALLRRAVEIDPYNGSYLDSLGWAYFKQGSLERAREYLLRAGDQMPSNSVVQDHVGDLLFALKDHSGAIAAWERALAGDGRSIERLEIQQKIEKARARE